MVRSRKFRVSHWPKFLGGPVKAKSGAYSDEREGETDFAPFMISGAGRYRTFVMSFERVEQEHRVRGSERVRHGISGYSLFSGEFVRRRVGGVICEWRHVPFNEKNGFSSGQGRALCILPIIPAPNLRVTFCNHALKEGCYA